MLGCPRPVPETCLSHQFLLGKCFPELAWGPSCVGSAGIGIKGEVIGSVF